MSRKKSLIADYLLPSALCLVLLAGCSPGDNNKAPQAGDDHFRIKNGETRNFLPSDLLGNDSDPDGDTLKLVSVTTPAHGTLTPLPDGGGYRYTNDGSNSSSDGFSYQVGDNNGGRASATVTLGVTPGPTANDDSAATNEDTSVTIDVADNDSSAIDDTTAIHSQPANGNATVNPDGTVNYTPTPDFNGSDSFTYTIKNSSGIPSNPATVTITVKPMNEAPQANHDNTPSTEDTPVTIDILANDTDVENDIDPTTISIITLPANGDVVINDGKTIYTPDSDYSGSDSFSYTVQDQGNLTSNTATVTIVVTNTNDAPVAIGSCSTTKQGNSITRTLGATDADPGETLTFALGTNGSSGNGPVTTANGGTVTITNSSTGAYTYTPKPGKGGRGKDTFTYRVTDTSSATSTATETVIVDLKIMPLGDSITSGLTDVGNGGVPSIPGRKGYRQPLQQKLVSYGYGFDFVGSLDHGCNLGYDYDAEGWPGYTAAQIVDGLGASNINLCNGQTAPSYSGIQDALNDNPADVVLLHIGTNNMSTTDVDDIEDILNAIDLWEEQSPNGNPVTVVLARIIDQWHWKSGDGHPNNVVNSAVSQLNNDIDTMVANRPNDDIIVVNMQGAFDYPDDLGDRSRTDWHYWLHPDTTGYNKMADVWLYPLIHQGTNKVTQGATGSLLDKCN